MDFSPELQQEFGQFQQLQEQYQMFSTQRAQMELQLKEFEGTIEKLTGIEDPTDLYQTIGSVMVKVSSKDKLLEDLAEKVETITRRVGSMKQQEDRLKTRLESMGKELNEKIKNSGLM
jgi:prefoldin beta subunit